MKQKYKNELKIVIKEDNAREGTATMCSAGGSVQFQAMAILILRRLVKHLEDKIMKDTEKKHTVISTEDGIGEKTTGKEFEKLLKELGEINDDGCK